MKSSSSASQGNQTPDWAQVIESAIRELGNGPTLAAFGIARADCALVHMDYFLGVEHFKDRA